MKRYLVANEIIDIYTSATAKEVTLKRLKRLAKRHNLCVGRIRQVVDIISNYMSEGCNAKRMSSEYLTAANAIKTTLFPKEETNLFDGTEPIKTEKIATKRATDRYTRIEEASRVFDEAISQFIVEEVEANIRDMKKELSSVRNALSEAEKVNKILEEKIKNATPTQKGWIEGLKKMLPNK